MMSIACVFAAVLLAQSGTVTQPASTPASTPVTSPAARATSHADGPFRIIKTLPLGGEGGWDLLAVDAENHHLFLPRGDRVTVVDLTTGTSVGDIPNTHGVHGVAIAAPENKAYISNGKSGTVSVVDLKTLQTLQVARVGENPDAIIFDPVTSLVVVFNGKSKDAAVMSAPTGAVMGIFPVGGKPELPVLDGSGRIFVNIEDTNEVILIDPRTRKIEKRFPLAPGTGPTGLAFDAAHKRLFAACSNEKLVVLDSESGKVITTVPIGKGVDGAEFDATRGYVLTSNGDGTLSVISGTNDDYKVVQTLPTGPRARTMAIDPKTQLIYLPCAEFEAPKPDDAAASRRPVMKAGSFRIVVVGT
jgi:YVTN family beta-propeller protein